MEIRSDEQLLRDYLDGQASGFELLVRRHSQQLYQFVLRFTRNTAAAEDVVQETFLQVNLAAPTFDLTRRLKPWLFTIAANKARDWLRSRNRKREVPLDLPTDGEEEREARLLNLLEQEVDHPHENLELTEKRRLVRHVVDEMPRHLMEVMTLAYYHHLRYREIAEILDVPLGTVKSRLHAAVAYFGEEYRKQSTAIH